MGSRAVERYLEAMPTEPDADLLQELLDERVHLLIRINLIENGQPDPRRVAGLLKRRLGAIERQIDSERRTNAASWRARAFMKKDAR